MLRIKSLGTYSDTIKLYQLIRDIFETDTGLIITGLDVTQVNTQTVRVAKGKGLTSKLDIIELTENTDIDITTIMSQGLPNIPDGNHVLGIGLDTKNKPHFILLLELNTGVFDNPLRTFLPLKVIEVQSGSINSLSDVYLNWEVRRFTATSDQEPAGGGSEPIDHNTLQNLQGGNPPDEFYHLSQQEYSDLQELLTNSFTIKAKSDDPNPGFLIDKISNHHFIIDANNKLELSAKSIKEGDIKDNLNGSSIGLNAESLGPGKYRVCEDDIVNTDAAHSRLLWDATKIVARVQRSVEKFVSSVDDIFPMVTPNYSCLISPGASGIFSGHDNNIAVLIGNDINNASSWTFYEPQMGEIVYVTQQHKYMKFTGSSWVDYIPSVPGHTGDVQFRSSSGELQGDSNFSYNSSEQKLYVPYVQSRFIAATGENGITITITVADGTGGTPWTLKFVNGILTSAQQS